MRIASGSLVPALLLVAATCAQAHHSYAMFDGSRPMTVSGVVAKFEWTNPHVFVWVYVPSATSQGKYDLFAFENGSPMATSRLGWSATALKYGDKIKIDYVPLRDGRNGGHITQVTLPDGRVLRAAGGPPRMPPGPPPPSSDR